MLDAIGAWLAQYGVWGLVVLMLIAAASGTIMLLLRGTIVPARTLDREQQDRRDMLAPMGKMADSVDRLGDAVSGFQASERDTQEVLHTVVKLLEEIQQHSDRGSS